MRESAGEARATERMAGLAVSVRFDDLPAATVAAAKRLTLDTLCCAVAGIGEESGRIVADVMGHGGGLAESTVVRTGERLPALSATFVNAHAANVLDADDTVRYKGHVGAATVPAALAFAERAAATGCDFLAAVVAGYEVATRIGLSLKGMVIGPTGATEFAPVTGYSWTGFASTVAAGRLIGLDKGKMRTAFGITGSTLPLPGSTPFGASLPRPMTKYAMYGSIAQAGAIAALLAERGFSAEPATLDGDKGLWRTLGSLDCDWQWMLERPRDRWMVEDACFKPYPACRFNNPAIDMFLELQRRHRIDPGIIDAVEVLVPAAGLRKHRAHLAEPDSLVDASFSLPHLLGAAAYAGRPGAAWLNAKARGDPRIRALAAKVHVGPEPRADLIAAEDLRQRGHLARMPTTVTIRSGSREYRLSAEYARGDVYDPLAEFSDADLAAKVHDFCGPILGGVQVENLLVAVHDLDSLPDVGQLTRALIAGTREPATAGATQGLAHS